jgi:hypothetical protein
MKCQGGVEAHGVADTKKHNKIGLREHQANIMHGFYLTWLPNIIFKKCQFLSNFEVFLSFLLICQIFANF